MKLIFSVKIMDWFFELLSNKVLVNAVIAWLVAQIVKFLLYALMNKEIRIERMFGDGGMPSCHSATVTSMAITALISYGPASFEFAVTAMLAIIVMHDATGVRQEAGKHAKAINEIFEMLQSFDKDTTDVKMNKLRELVGHTPLQVFCGMTLGVAIALIFR